MIKCIVVENDIHTQKHVVSTLKKMADVEIVAVFDTALAAITILSTNEVDLVFCAIQMPDINGLSLFKSLQNPPFFAFVTTDPTYAVACYELNVLDYILKPFGIERLLKTVNKAKNLLRSRKAENLASDYMVIKDKQYSFITSYDDICYIQADKDYVHIWTIKREYYVWRKLIDLEDTLKGMRRFARVHKSYIINLDYAEHVIGNTIKMKGKLPEIPIGGRYKVELFKKLGAASR
ncbi:LytR/AlgR family response regulator transcription factor [Sphingobacterium deserti]|uniref:Two component transcriptional regulator, LytTR family n=1 Tax=Sphingobacterium deserti TaxID=1229276 RepID=A0A0B8T102_9SPHI|nr:LytTR family DNA-binding domain-containing protein [Sphingobacterium deserti]KGE14231.1 two component transcriptional regulator, LytTR family [Sphingobacterium deserti]